MEKIDHLMRQLLRAMKAGQAVVTLDHPPDGWPRRALAASCREALYTAAREAQLDPGQRRLWLERWALDGGPPVTVDALAARETISPQTVRRRLARVSRIVSRHLAERPPELPVPSDGGRLRAETVIALTESEAALHGHRDVEHEDAIRTARRDHLGQQLRVRRAGADRGRRAKHRRLVDGAIDDAVRRGHRRLAKPDLSGGRPDLDQLAELADQLSTDALEEDARAELDARLEAGWRLGAFRDTVPAEIQRPFLLRQTTRWREEADPRCLAVVQWTSHRLTPADPARVALLRDGVISATEQGYPGLAHAYFRLAIAARREFESRLALDGAHHAAANRLEEITRTARLASASVVLGSIEHRKLAASLLDTEKDLALVPQFALVRAARLAELHEAAHANRTGAERRARPSPFPYWDVLEAAGAYQDGATLVFRLKWREAYLRLALLFGLDDMFTEFSDSVAHLLAAHQPAHRHIADLTSWMEAGRMAFGDSVAGTAAASFVLG